MWLGDILFYMNFSRLSRDKNKLPHSIRIKRYNGFIVRTAKEENSLPESAEIEVLSVLHLQPRHCLLSNEMVDKRKLSSIIKLTNFIISPVPLLLTISILWNCGNEMLRQYISTMQHDLPRPREPFKRDTVDLAYGAIKGAGGVFSQ